MDLNHNQKIFLQLIKLLSKNWQDKFKTIFDCSPINKNFTEISMNLSELINEDLIQLNLNEINISIKYCDILLESLWEMFNIGDWKNVHRSYRYLYGYISLFKIFFLLCQQKADDVDCENLKRCLHCCDLGLIMSPKFLDNLLSRIATELHDHLVTHLPFQLNLIENENICKFNYEIKFPIKREKRLSIEDFDRNYFQPKIPVIIENGIDDWPALNKNSQNFWSLSYILNKCGYRTVPVEIGSKYTDHNWSQKLMTIEKFTDEYIIKSSTTIAYVAQHNLFEQITELSKDFSIPDYCVCNRDLDLNQDEAETEDTEIDINAWFGPSATVSPLHYDPNDNLFAQVMGSKYIRLYSDSSPEEMIYPNEHHLLANTSKVDIENIDKIKFPLFEKLSYNECILNSGELLFIPKKYWHFVKSLKTSFSISFWWK